MPELTAVEQQRTAGFVNPKYNRSQARKEKLEQEERELEELVAQNRGEGESGHTGDNSSDGEADLDKETQKAKPQEKEDEHSTSEKKEAGEKEEESEENLTAEEKSFKKRYGDLRRHMQKKEKQWEERLEKLQNKEIEPPASEEDIKKWQAKYPQVAKIIETVAHKKAEEMFNKADERLREFDDFTHEAEREKSMKVIRKAHEDFDELREADDFHQWADEQPKWVQDALYENEDDPKSVIRVIDLYKSDKGMTKRDKKRDEKAAASQVSTRNTRTKVDADESGRKIKESDVAKMSMKEYEAKEEDIQKAIQSGNFIYDVSGGAR